MKSGQTHQRSKSNPQQTIWEDIKVEFEPPYPLSLPARRHWDRISGQIHAQGRWKAISHDLLANFCQVLALSQECMNAILADGVVVSGARSERDKVRHPLLTPWSQTQAALVKLARAIPLADPNVDTHSNDIDRMIEAFIK
jgi:phage terminase small subunit